MIRTPHLGASTREAQESVGIEVAEQVRECLAGGSIRNAVNMPTLDAKTLAALQPYLRFGETLGRVLAQIGPARTERLVIEFGGKATELAADPMVRAVLKGFLHQVEGPDVNFVNAPTIATQLGIQVSEVKSTEPVDYAELFVVRAQTDGVEASVAGTFYGSVHNPRIVRINGMPVEAVPQGVLLLVSNQDRPGMVGWVGTILGKHQINIAYMSLGRDQPDGRALTVLNLDSVSSAAVLDELRADKDILDVRVVSL
ncbi:ACT domain-containing protein [bacterium]|nr:ACT domain-containing protein [bacterium]